VHRLRRIALAAVILGALAPPASASAASSALSTTVTLFASSSPLVSDGQRIVAFTPRADVVRVVDTVTDTVTDEAAPTCLPESMTVGRILLGCGLGSASPFTAPSMLDLDTKQVVTAPLNMSEVPSSISADAVKKAYWAAIGRYWIGGAVRNTAGKSRALYVDWHTGKVRTIVRKSRHGQAPALDDVGLRTLPDPTILGRSGGYTLYGGAGPLGLLAPDKQTTILSECHGGCEQVQISAGAVTWRQGKRIEAYTIKSEASKSWPAHAAASNKKVTVVHTANAVVWAAPAAPSANHVVLTHFYARTLPG
jgi:hypothetical protein